jgi:hypothetical protein
MAPATTLTAEDLQATRAMEALIDDPAAPAAHGYEKLMSSRNGDTDMLVLYARPYAGNPAIREFLCIGGAPVTSAAMFDVLMDAEYRVQWDSSCAAHSELQTFPAGEGMTHSLNHWVVKYPCPLSKRDYCYERFTQAVPGAQDMYYLVTQAVVSPLCPEASKVVRVLESKTAYCLRQQHRPDGKPFCQFAYTAIDNPRGNIPNSIVSFLTSKTLPGVMKSLYDACSRRQMVKK